MPQSLVAPGFEAPIGTGTDAYPAEAERACAGDKMRLKPYGWHKVLLMGSFLTGGLHAAWFEAMRQRDPMSDG
jgi:hypothetical protein